MTKLKEIRLSRNIKQAELARLLHVQSACVSIAEKKGIRNADAAERYAAVLKCHPAELIDFKSPRVCAGKQ